mmetsp:Transcript_29334/g.56302  ORF Transcript_29334/g.56302 Transcript_29334/m.56302 type:complete len:418 (-) Transcript_29334:249-1502(-)
MASATMRAIQRLRDPTDTTAMLTVASLLMMAELGLCVLIFLKVPYTEIDWIAYMQEVEGYLAGETDYTKLQGQTGPLVYPAGFVYVFSLLRQCTGGDVVAGQMIFIGVYLANTALVFAVYARSRKVPPWALVLLCLSKRVHSIFILRLFNDGVAALLAHASILVLQGRSWRAGLLVFSAAVSIKMNVLLYAPSLLLLLLKGTTLWNTFCSIGLAALLQLVLGAPFLYTNAWGYISMSFDLGRKFIYYWTVNFKFLPESTFLSKEWAVLLLGMHIGMLFLFAQYSWCKRDGGIISAVQKSMSSKAAALHKYDRVALTTEHITTVMFVGNFIGIVFARTLHYQFYCWYFHTIPYLLWCTNIPTPIRICLWAAIEVIWNVFPSTAVSSAGLWVCHLTILVGLWRAELEPTASRSPPNKIE